MGFWIKSKEPLKAIVEDDHYKKKRTRFKPSWGNEPVTKQSICDEIAYICREFTCLIPDVHRMQCREEIQEINDRARKIKDMLDRL